jgi:hypothetical protein
VGIAWRRVRVGIEDLAAFDAVFLTPARGVAVVEAIDDARFPSDADVEPAVADTCAAVPGIRSDVSLPRARLGRSW